MGIGKVEAKKLGGEKKKKMKTKTIAVLEILVVLCSVFLVALPAIAADQNQETQTVSASTSEVTTASEDEFTLGIYGNANEDDTIDMRDTTYIKLVIFGKKPKTDLADANYDGKISMLDVGQTKLIILGKEKELTFEDLYDDVVTVRKPVKRIVTGHSTSFQVLRALGAGDNIVGISSHTIRKMGKAFLQDYAELPLIGSRNYESILTLHPDLYVVNAESPSVVEEAKEKLPGVTVIALVCTNLPLSDNTESIRKLGYILNRKDEAEEFIEWYNGYRDKIKERTARLSENEKPQILFELYDPYSCWCQYEEQVDLTGGRNICADLCKGAEGYTYKVDPEWVIVQNPDVILYTSGYITYADDQDPSEMIATREEILNRPGFKSITAVREGRVYIMHRHAITMFPCNIIGMGYMAKWFHPDLFEDLDPHAIHQEYLNRFQHIDYDLDEHGVFVYPPLKD